MRRGKIFSIKSTTGWKDVRTPPELAVTLVTRHQSQIYLTNRSPPHAAGTALLLCGARYIASHNGTLTAVIFQPVEKDTAQRNK